MIFLNNYCIYYFHQSFFFHIFAIIACGQIQIGLIKNDKLYFFKHNWLMWKGVYNMW